MNKCEDLIAWQKSMDFVVEVYKIVKLLPQEERFALADQMRRSVVSVPSNIAEGYGRFGLKECANFLSIALGSLAECVTQLHICLRLGYVSSNEINYLLLCSDELSKIITGLRKSFVDRVNVSS